MLLLDSITIRNFLSIGAVSQTVSLSEAPLTLVLGLNLDTGGDDSRNGAGKTSLLQAISFVLFDEPLTKIRKDNLVNDINNKDMLVTIRFHRDGVPYRIERGRKPNILRFFVGAEEVDTAQGENRKTQVEIERIIGMSRTMFCHIVALNTSTTPFLRMRPAEQREVIEELMGITQISALAEQLKQAMDGNKEALRHEEAAIKAISEANARIELAIERARAAATDWDRKQDDLLDDLGRRVTKLSEMDVDAELAVFDRIDLWNRKHREVLDRVDAVVTRVNAIAPVKKRLQADLERYQRESAASGTTEVERLVAQAGRLRREAGLDVSAEVERFNRQMARQSQDVERLAGQIDALVAERDAIGVQLAAPDAHHCNTCGQGLAGTDHLGKVIAALEQQQTDIDQRVAAVGREREQIMFDLGNVRTEMTELVDRHTAKQMGLKQQADAIDQEIEALRAQAIIDRDLAAQRVSEVTTEIANYDQQVFGHQEELDNLGRNRDALGDAPVSRYASRDVLWQARQDRDKAISQLEIELERVNPMASRIEGLVSTITSIDYTKLNELVGQLKHEQFLYKLLTSKDSFIRKRIVDQNLHFLNRHLNSYLDRLGLPHEVRFTADLAVDISLMGRGLDFEQFSRGEMNRVILATSWSFRDLWENLNFSFNLMVVDELLDQGMDRSGVSSATQILQQISSERKKNIMLVSHREELCDRSDAILLVTKENGFSTVSVGG